ncbi:hypothetical protein KSP40_PGU009802 [Platanthera guangdongensis]|uniref:Uncharacterized protein n=1 Tax=Platanthera guangdongensis TaxID=2320717 RepID=A0ABR2MUR6_9ASPA
MLTGLHLGHPNDGLSNCTIFRRKPKIDKQIEITTTYLEQVSDLLHLSHHRHRNSRDLHFHLLTIISLIQ